MRYASRTSIFFSVAAVGLIFLFATFSSLYTENKIRAFEQISPIQTPQITATVTSAWDELLQKTPVAYGTPLPAPVPSALDGTYAKLDPSWPQWWLCKRCADYRDAGGLWKVQFDRGVMRIFYEITGWKGIASFTVSGDRLTIFNDPWCPDETGQYTWVLENGQLNLSVIKDACSFGLRAKNLTKQPWPSCSPPDEAADNADAEWQSPVGCQESPITPLDEHPTNLQVTVHGGDSRFFEKPPDLIAFANSTDNSAPEGVQITRHPESIPYGLQCVLWWQGDWVEASTDLSVSSMGVQFFGDPPIGWARVLFDGVEVWRGDTSAIWSHHGRHGGYIEISGFSPGQHTIRAESLDFDYHPVTVASFGFSREGGVKSETSN